MFYFPLILSTDGDLFDPDNIHQKYIRIAFLLTFSSLLGNYKRYMYEGEFNKKEFLERQSESSQVNSMVTFDSSIRSFSLLLWKLKHGCNMNHAQIIYSMA